jgi:hypothetical protein
MGWAPHKQQPRVLNFVTQPALNSCTVFRFRCWSLVLGLPLASFWHGVSVLCLPLVLSLTFHFFFLFKPNPSYFKRRRVIFRPLFEEKGKKGTLIAPLVVDAMYVANSRGSVYSRSEVPGSSRGPGCIAENFTSAW